MRKLYLIAMTSILFSGCATFKGLDENHVTLTGIRSATCQDFASCQYALVRRFDGANAAWATMNNVIP